MSAIQPIPQTFPLVNRDGKYTVIFKRFLDDLLNRTGGILGGTYQQLTPNGAALLWNLDITPIIVVVLTDPVTTIASINQVAGAPLYHLTLVQDAVGGRLVTWGPEFKWPSGIPPVLSVGANAVDDIVFASDGNNMKFQYGVKDIR